MLTCAIRSGIYELDDLTSLMCGPVQWLLSAYRRPSSPEMRRIAMIPEVCPTFVCLSILLYAVASRTLACALRLRDPSPQSATYQSRVMAELACSYSFARTTCRCVTAQMACIDYRSVSLVGSWAATMHNTLKVDEAVLAIECSHRRPAYICAQVQAELLED